MILWSSIAVLLLLATRSPAAQEYDPNGDSDVYAYAVRALRELEARKAAAAPTVIQRASSVCYGELGCFDKEGTFKHLKQLPEPPETVNAQFLLYTRKNRQEPQFLNWRKPETVVDSNVDPSKPLKFISHGFGGKNNLTWVWQMKNALLEKHDVNVICVDWSLGARVPYYIQASVNSELVGAELAVLFFILKDRLGMQEKDLHLIGFSLGAHVVGFAGKRMKEMRGTRPARITGLDPASPLFEEYGGEVHLFKEDADFVDVVHTNADLLLYGGMGIGIEIGHADFYPNGGKRQPGCKSTLTGAITDIFKGDRDRACNHERAVHLFTDSILSPEPCRFIGYKCANYTEFSGAKCVHANCEEGDQCGRMGYQVQGSGTYYLMTRAKKPYCTDLAKLSVHFAKDIKRSYGSIILTVVGTDHVAENITLTEKDEKLVPGSSRTVAIPLGEGMKPPKAVMALYIRYGGWITKGTPTYGLGSVSISDSQGKDIFNTCGETVILNDNEYQILENRSC